MSYPEKVSYETAVLALLSVSRGVEPRKKILFVLLFDHKNCNQIAKEVGLGWLSVQKYLFSLMEQDLVKSSSLAGSKFYMLTPLGEEVKRALYSSNQKDFGISSREYKGRQ
ncbi:MAG: hypothetical protein QM398_02355 [Thermoproteota archaeon]|nr:hypothetical protein [Thermoproteota archaeon]NLD66184.1 hypothetical protein [Thermoproteota archaeon]